MFAALALHVIDYRQEDVVARTWAITKQQGVAIGLDTVGGDNGIDVANALCFEGQMVELVQTARTNAYEGAFMKGLSFHQLSLGPAPVRLSRAKHTSRAGAHFHT